MKYVWSLRVIGNIFTFIGLTWIIGFFRSNSSLISHYSFGGYIFKDELIVFLIIMVVCTAIGVVSEYRENKISKKITEKR